MHSVLNVLHYESVVIVLGASMHASGAQADTVVLVPLQGASLAPVKFGHVLIVPLKD